MENLFPQNVGSINNLFRVIKLFWGSSSPMGEILVSFDHNQLRTMASETVDPIDWSQPTPSWAVPLELNVLHGMNAAYKSQDLLQQPGLKHVHGYARPTQALSDLCGHSGYGDKINILFLLIYIYI